MRRLIRLIAASALFLPLASHALPPMPSIAEQYRAADVALLATIVAVRSRDYNAISRAAEVQLQVEEIFKGEAPQSLTVNFLVFPESLENHMREPPPEGRYIVFLERRTRENDAGRASYALFPARPRAFSFLLYSDERLAEIKSLAGR
jgi:hypothetical protein